MQMKLVIELTDKMHQAVKDGTWCGNDLWYNALKDATPLEKVLEEIKGEIENDWQLKEMPSAPFSCGLRKALEIIENHIGDTKC